MRSPAVIEQNNATGRVAYWQGADNQSVADRHGISLADYIHAMYFFLRQRQARDVVMIGCGGGTLATMLRRAGVGVSIADIDPASFEIARRYFHLPDGIACHVADGRAYLKHRKTRCDAVVLDAYSDNAIPKHLLTPAFFALVKMRLRRGGLFLVNLLAKDDDDRAADEIARRMQKTWRDVRLLDADGWEDRNVVAVAGAVRDLKRPRLLLKPQRCAKSIAAGLKALDFRPLRS